MTDDEERRLRERYLRRVRERANAAEDSVFVSPLISVLDELEALKQAHPDRRYEDDPRASRRVLRTRLG